MDIAPMMEKMRLALADTERAMAEPGAFDDRAKSEALGREHQRLTGLVTAWDALQSARSELKDNEEMLATEEDEEFRALVQADIERLQGEVERLDKKVLGLIVPPGEHDSRNTIIEIRPAAGGDEAALFANDLFRMYMSYAERQGWKTEILDCDETVLGGMKTVSFMVSGTDTYRHLQLESGVHRVQRVPSTETQGRIHTSTVTVAVLAEAKEVDVQINPADLEIAAFRASGAGGQHVNTTDSAVRIVHKPTGVVVASQQERSQHRNKEIAMRMLLAKLLEHKEQVEAAKYAAERKSQVGTGDRSERIRTYNFPQNRVTDHRYGLSWFDMPTIMGGGLDDILADIFAAHNTLRLQAELDRA